MLPEQVFVMQTVSWANQENGNLASGDQTQPMHTLPIRKVEQFPTLSNSSNNILHQSFGESGVAESQGRQGISL